MGYAKKQLPLVVIVGRTNVGKSTLFNCLVEKNKALTSNIPCTTRDSNIGEVDWQGFNFTLVDTGGIIDLKHLLKEKNPTANNDIDIKVQKQARDYLKRADLILFLVDVKEGLLPPDKQLALFIKKMLPQSNHIFLVANKVDGPKQRKEIAEFNKLPLGEPIPISAATGSGTGDLLDIITKKIKKTKTLVNPLSLSNKGAAVRFAGATARREEEIRVCILGKPNVGKSSLLNALLGAAYPEQGQKEKAIVSSIPHTTREPQDVQFAYQDHLITLIDTAGISKRGQRTAKQIKFRNTLEKFSITKSLKALERANIALLVLDMNKEITHQDAKLVEEIIKQKVSLIIIANKWDLIKERNTKLYTNNIYLALPFARWAPVQFTSAKTREKTNKIFDLIIRVMEQRKTEININALNKFLNKIVKIHRPAKAKGTKHPHIYELKQVHANPPKFSLRIGAKDSLHFSYLRFIENRLREKFGFGGTPITIGLEKNKKNSWKT